MRLPQLSKVHQSILDALRNNTQKSSDHQALTKDFSKKGAPAPAPAFTPRKSRVSSPLQ
jgi:hypothetical protein